NGLQSMTWVKPVFPGGIKSYELRCDYVALPDTADLMTKHDWWRDAKVFKRSDGTDIPIDATSVTIKLRPEEPTHCVLRAANQKDLLTPLETSSTSKSTDATKLVLNDAVLATGTSNSNFGYQVAPAGDLDNDGKADVLVGGPGRVELIFGNAVVASAT